MKDLEADNIIKAGTTSWFELNKEGGYVESATGIKRTAAQSSSASTSQVTPKPRQPTKNLSEYGLNNQHIPLLQGITFPPERRTGVLKSLGPLATTNIIDQ